MIFVDIKNSLIDIVDTILFKTIHITILTDVITSMIIHIDIIIFKLFSINPNYEEQNNDFQNQQLNLNCLDYAVCEGTYGQVECQESHQWW